MLKDRGTRHSRDARQTLAIAGGEALLEPDAEVVLLASKLQAVVDSGVGRLVVVGGEAGVGNSALLKRSPPGLDGARGMHGGRRDHPHRDTVIVHADPIAPPHAATTG